MIALLLMSAISIEPSILEFIDDTQCLPDEACVANRICGFGTEKNYEIARNDLFVATGRPLSCINKCSCNASSVNAISRMLAQAAANDAAGSNTTLYGNNEICNNPVMKAAMYFYTSGFECESIFVEAQSDLIRLCGFQNGRPCYGKCTEHYQIDSPPPPCESKVGIDKTTMYLIGLYVFIATSMWTWTGSIDLAPPSQSSTRLKMRYKTHNDSSESLLSFFN
jgi:hypothetical protein